uniref:U41-Sparatoxin-Hju1d_1 n=1 Tax=Heteropoda jugulans TaxID=1358901 RepID=A0A4Q8K446_9ARAC
MKVTLLFLVLSGILGVSLAYTVCTKQSDCQEDECCLDTLFSNEHIVRRDIQQEAGALQRLYTSLRKTCTTLPVLAFLCTSALGKE